VAVKLVETLALIVEIPEVPEVPFPDVPEDPVDPLIVNERQGLVKVVVPDPPI